MKLKADITPDSKEVSKKALKDSSIKVKVTIDKNNTRRNQIENCDTCNGNPNLVDFELDGFQGKRCDNPSCMLVYEWEKK